MIRALTVTLITCLGTVAWGQGAPQPASGTDAATSLRLMGMPGQPPAIQAIVGAEFADQASGNAGQGAADNLLASAATREMYDPPPPTVDALPSSQRIGQAVEANRLKLLQTLTGREAGRDTHTRGIEKSMLSAMPNSPPPQLSAVSARVQAGSQVIAASEEFKQRAVQLDADYSKEVKGMLVLAAIKGASAGLNSYTPDSVTPATVDSIRRIILGNNNAHIPPELAMAFGDDRLKDLEAAPVDMVKDVLTAYIESRTANTLDQDASTLQTDLASAGAKVAQQVTDVRNKVEETTKSIKDLATAFQDEAAVLGNQTHSTPSNDPDDSMSLRSEDDALWGQLSPSEKLFSLAQGDFVAPPPPAPPDGTLDAVPTLQVSLQNADDVMTARDTVLGQLNDVKALGTLAASLGVPVDTYNLSKNIDTATTAINLAANVASGNWVAAFSLGAGLLGGGPSEDPTQAALSKMSKQLADIMKTQREILQKLDQLSAQLQASTDQLLVKMDQIRALVQRVLVVEEQQSEIPLRECELFVGNAYGNNLQNGIFPSYASRVKAYSTQDMPRYFSECKNFLDAVRHVTLRNEGNRPPTLLNTVFLADPSADLASKAVGYQNMLNNSEHLLGIRDGLPSKPNCSTQFLWAASLGVRYFSDLPRDGLACPGEYDISASSLLCDGQPGHECRMMHRATEAPGANSPPLVVAPNDALDIAVVAENVQEIGEFVLFFTAYQTFLKAPESGQYDVMLTPDELAGPARPENVELYLWANSFLDIANIAIAQQSISSGAVITKATADFLKFQNYGVGAKFAPDDASDPSINKDWPAPSQLPERTAIQDLISNRSVDPKLPDIYDYEATVTMLADNPTYRANVIRDIVVRRLQLNQVTSPEYVLGLKSPNSVFIARMLKGSTPADDLPLVYSPKDGPTGWSLVLAVKHGKKLYLPLPSVTAAYANAVVYLPTAEGLFALRESLMNRILFSDPNAIAVVESTDPSAKRLIRLEALGDRTLAELHLSPSLFVDSDQGSTVYICNDNGCNEDKNAKATTFRALSF